MKTCCKCNTLKELDCFARNGEYFRTSCLECHRKSEQKRYKRDKKAVLEKQKQNYNPVKKKEYYDKNKDKIRNCKLKLNYGVTLEQYAKMLVSQDFKCFICNTHADNHKKAFAVDHCHSSGKVRGLLCSTCNLMLGLAKDNTKTLEQAIAYLNQFKD